MFVSLSHSHKQTLGQIHEAPAAFTITKGIMKQQSLQV